MFLVTSSFGKEILRKGRGTKVNSKRQHRLLESTFSWQNQCKSQFQVWAPPLSINNFFIKLMQNQFQEEVPPVRINIFLRRPMQKIIPRVGVTSRNQHFPEKTNAKVIETALQQYWNIFNSIGTALKQYWSSTGTVLEQYWHSIGVVLVQYWNSTGTVLEQHWNSTGAVLMHYSNSIETALKQYWSTTGTVLK